MLLLRTIHRALQAAGRLLKVVVLVDGLGDVPGAAHALGEDDQVPRGDLHELLPVALRVHLHLPLQQVAGLLGRVGPRELALLAPPPDPFAHSPADAAVSIQQGGREHREAGDGGEIRDAREGG